MGLAIARPDVLSYAARRHKPVNCRTMSNDRIPDVRDGLTREQRVVLYVLSQLQKERGDHNVPTTLLWGRVCEYFYISPEDSPRCSRSSVPGNTLVD